jgi:hypothetical protein
MSNRQKKTLRYKTPRLLFVEPLFTECQNGSLANTSGGTECANGVGATMRCGAGAGDTEHRDYNCTNGDIASHNCNTGHTNNPSSCADGLAFITGCATGTIV